MGINENHVERLVPGSWAWNLDISAHEHRYSFASKFVFGKRVLDAGCGVGYGSRLLAYHGASEVVGVDISQEALAVARKQFSHSRVKYICDDCESMMKVNGRFDVIVSLENLEHLQDAEGFLNRATELLSPTGSLICSSPNPQGNPESPDNPYHVREYTKEQFQNLLQKYFWNVAILGQDNTSAVKALNILWSNPMLRFGRWIQKLRGRYLNHPFSTYPPSPGDFVISEFASDQPRVFISVCEGPKR